MLGSLCEVVMLPVNGLDKIIDSRKKFLISSIFSFGALIL